MGRWFLDCSIQIDSIPILTLLNTSSGEARSRLPSQMLTSLHVQCSHHKGIDRTNTGFGTKNFPYDLYKYYDKRYSILQITNLAREVYAKPTLLILNSWNLFYSIVDLLFYILWAAKYSTQMSRPWPGTIILPPGLTTELSSRSMGPLLFLIMSSFLNLLRLWMCALAMVVSGRVKSWKFQERRLLFKYTFF